MLSDLTEVTTGNLLSAVAAKHALGYRFVTMTCTDLGEAHDVLYHFDLNYRLETLRLRLAKGEALQSISKIYFAAVLVENEIKDLFGINVQGLAIDYEGRFLLSEGAPTAPFNQPAAAPGAAPQKSEEGGA
jgi:NADH:ubiquinone oxidoreductase subunit C